MTRDIDGDPDKRPLEPLGVVIGWVLYVPYLMGPQSVCVQEDVTDIVMDRVTSSQIPVV